jgi:uncharacterized Zn-binding protein involved in type VI secretion
MAGHGLGRKDLDEAKGACAHLCPKCAPHTVQGAAVTGSPDVKVDHENKPALRVGDHGRHKKCCKDNTWEAVTGSSSVFINGKKAFREGDQTKHCGGVGKLLTGSTTVFVGD